MSCRTVFGRPLVRIALLTVMLSAAPPLARSAHAAANVGIEGGVVERKTSGAPTLSPGIGFGSHIEIGPTDFINFGTYYLLSINEFSGDSSRDALFNTLGLRARLAWPLGDFKPYAWTGVGLTWSRYRTPENSNIRGQFWEIPVGVGIGYRVLELFQVAVEGAYRPSTSFTGTAYEVVHFPSPSSGWSAMFVLALDI